MKGQRANGKKNAFVSGKLNSVVTILVAYIIIYYNTFTHIDSHTFTMAVHTAHTTHN